MFDPTPITTQSFTPPVSSFTVLFFYFYLTMRVCDCECVTVCVRVYVSMSLATEERGYEQVND